MRLALGALLPAVEQHGYLRLAHRGDDGLPRLLVAFDLHRGIGLARLLDEREELVLLGAVLGLDGDAVLRVGELERRRLDLAGDGQRIAGLGGQLGNDHDVARIGMADLGHLAAAHHVEVRQALALARARVHELHARLDGAGEHLDEGDASLLGIVEGLEDEDDGTLVIGGDLEGVAVDQRHLAVVGGRGEVGGDVVHQGVDALLLRAATGEHRDEQALGDGGGQQALDLFLRKALALEVLLHELVVGLGNQLAQRFMRGLCLRAQLLGDVELGLIGAVALARLHADQVDDAVEIRTGAPGQGHGAQAHTEALAQHLHAHSVIGVLLVDAVDEHRARQAQVLGGVP